MMWLTFRVAAMSTTPGRRRFGASAICVLALTGPRILAQQDPAAALYAQIGRIFAARASA